MMNQQGRRAILGFALAVVALGVGSSQLQSQTPNRAVKPGDEASETQSRTLIDVASLGPQVGERVPVFSLPDQNGELRSLESILGPNGALLLFHRSADW